MSQGAVQRRADRWSASKERRRGKRWRFDRVRRQVSIPGSTHSSCIWSAGENRDWRGALSVFPDVKKKGVKHDLVTYKALIGVFEKQWEKALEMSQEMKQKGVGPDKVTVDSLIRTMEEAPEGSQWEKALEVFQERGVKPNGSTCYVLTRVIQRLPGAVSGRKCYACCRI
uniref:Pentacotripeptide-repeat region of PRORP domain-containing protein n=1 Tax=Chromera velia CCMP2878 TaxID=1169474 RepID=A0A0G4F5T4_9ALVE|eukprot:Cvel_15194.t1-p1 / transcript=Cvel_15194.t1 / gene=Cvel_15194 / organism=Chromera_velia_CCMP2878 / gene_product=Pentatricopeptide repeat-containing protein, putative / transcript_product=Pentatricopeptide repeat-containing protein, putative / location=Cvel_scaffold1111:2208-2714(-) / protein_length=169 / sequence_SO=supercontig / SO=protein_coding / is_pseudo=false